jgi:hypothetical protein
MPHSLSSARRCNTWHDTSPPPASLPKAQRSGLFPLFPVPFILVQIWYPRVLWAADWVLTPVNTYFITVLSGIKFYSFT